jgi:hypothetical protein
LLLVTAGGVWVAVPDTETTVAVIAAWLPFAVLVAVTTTAKMAPHWTTVGQRDANFARGWVVVGWCGLGCVLAWAAAWGTDARVEARPGVWACFAVAGIAAGFGITRRALPSTTVVAGVQVVVIVAASRWAAHATSTVAGVARAVIVVAACAAVLLVSARGAEPARPPPSDPMARPR